MRQHGVLRNHPRACDQRFFGYALLRSTDDPLGDGTYSFGTDNAAYSRVSLAGSVRDNDYRTWVFSYLSGDDSFHPADFWEGALAGNHRGTNVLFLCGSPDYATTIWDSGGSFISGVTASVFEYCFRGNGVYAISTSTPNGSLIGIAYWD